MPWFSIGYMKYQGRKVGPGDPLGDFVDPSLHGTHAEWVNIDPTQSPPSDTENAGPESAKASAPLLTQPEPEALPPVPVPTQNNEPKRNKARRKKSKRKTGR